MLNIKVLLLLNLNILIIYLRGREGGLRPIILENLILKYEGQDTSRHFKGCFGSMCTMLPW